MLKGLLFLLFTGIALVALASLGMALLVAISGALWRAMTAPFKPRR
jgi:hypothetical protein